MGPDRLLGTWVLTRVVHDHRAGEWRDVAGTTSLTAESLDRIRWTEEGVMTWADHEVPVGRTLYVVREDSGWVVRFEDGRTFHPRSVGAPVHHPCSPDSYRGLIEVSGDPPDSWTVTWEALGPEKDYRMVSVNSDRAGLTRRG